MKMPTVRFVYDRKKTASRSHPALVHIEVVSEQKKKYISTHVKVCTNQWSDSRHVYNHEEAASLNKRLNAQMRNLQDWLCSLEARREPFEFDKLDRWLRMADVSTEFLAWVESEIDTRRDLAEGTLKSHRTMLNSLKAFGRIVYTTDLTKANIMAYDRWLHQRDYKQATIHGFHKNLKVYINRAIALDMVEKSPYTSLHIDRGRTSAPKYLTEEDVRKIQTAVIPNPSLARVRDVFLFQCYTGLSYADLAAFDFDKTEQRGDKIVYSGSREKTEERFHIVLIRAALAILERYDYKLPVLTNQKYNTSLKLISGMCGLNKLLTTHMARHTFATMALSKGAKIENVAKMLGHVKIETTQIYAKVLNDSVEADFDQLDTFFS